MYQYRVLVQRVSRWYKAHGDSLTWQETEDFLTALEWHTLHFLFSLIILLILLIVECYSVSYPWDKCNHSWKPHCFSSNTSPQNIFASWYFSGFLCGDPGSCPDLVSMFWMSLSFLKLCGYIKKGRTYLDHYLAKPAKWKFWVLV